MVIASPVERAGVPEIEQILSAGAVCFNLLQGAQALGRIASVLAHGEGLQAHAAAAEMRLKR